ncbi:hypothetical protein [Phytomonospora endophytica]|uniref:TolB-like protein n=1 Tax=Phytomonospora endophytica TaxID=714109 RepID=A0A841FPI4_9ACTN|nr:hypothetical protein [Phytomonospora endophytica]MBB6038025.1 TolB-like protein [Phytomonospora endophytica]
MDLQEVSLEFGPTLVLSDEVQEVIVASHARTIAASTDSIALEIMSNLSRAAGMFVVAGAAVLAPAGAKFAPRR